MRASFQGQGVIMLGNGIARLHSPRLVMDEPVKPPQPHNDDKAQALRSRAGCAEGGRDFPGGKAHRP